MTLLIGIEGRLRLAIAARWPSMRAFAREAGIPYRSLQNYLRGEQLPGSEALARCALLGIDVNWLLTGGRRRS